MMQQLGLMPEMTAPPGGASAPAAGDTTGKTMSDTAKMDTMKK
jgi:hypothetical protein